jgi:hypothetical protein
MAELFELKSISEGAVPLALEKAERYRLLSDPEQAQSICLDILEIDPEHQEALVTLILAITDQFREKGSACARTALSYIEHLTSDFQRAYYSGIVHEREARALLHRGRANAPAFIAFRNAMGWFEQADGLSPAGNDDARLRWNACVRAIRAAHLEPPEELRELPLE